MKTHRKVLKPSNLVVCTGTKNMAFLVLYGLCEARVVLWKNVHPPSFYLRKILATKWHSSITDGVSERLGLLFCSFTALSESASLFSHICFRVQGSFVHFTVSIGRLRRSGGNRNPSLVNLGHNEIKQRSRASERWMVWRRAHSHHMSAAHTRLTPALQCLSVLRRPTQGFQEQLVDRPDCQWKRPEGRAP